MHNPLAGKRASNRILNLIVSRLKESGINFILYNQNWPGDYSGFTEIWLVGGDGTLNYFINHFEFIIPLALFKGGTGNDFAWKLYGDISTNDQIDLVLQAKAKPVDAGICNGLYFLNTVGIGFDGKVLGLMNTIRYLGSMPGYYLAVFKTILTYREPLFQITGEYLQMTGKLLLCVVSNAPRTGGGFLLSPQADPVDGLLNLLLCKPLRLFQRLKLLSRVKKGQHINLPVIDHSLIEKISIHCGTSLPAQMDGELIQAPTFNIGIARNKFRFLY